MRFRFSPAAGTGAMRLMPVIWVAATLGATLAPILRHENNFEIFRTASNHFMAAKDLYVPSERHFDLFKYTPSFALLFVPFAVLPFTIGLFLWNALNAATLYWALGRLLPRTQAAVARAIVLGDLIGSLQSAQSNALIAALIILSFTELERGHDLRAAVAVVAGGFIKVFPLAGVSFALLHTKRRRFAFSCLAVGTVLFGAPLVFTGPAWLARQYSMWLSIQRVDAGDPGFSVMQQLKFWLGVHWPAWPQQLVGVALLLAPLVVHRERRADKDWRLLYVASLLMFCVLFNHQSESPSFVIAMTGVSVWFVRSWRSRWSWLVLGFVILGTVLVSSSAMPPAVRDQLTTWRFKAVPVLVVWIILQVEQWRSTPARRTALRENSAPAPAA